jgi:hypothetical protein
MRETLEGTHPPNNTHRHKPIDFVSGGEGIGKGGNRKISKFFVKVFE